MLHIKQKTEADTSKKEIGIKKLVRLYFFFFWTAKLILNLSNYSL